MVGEASHLQRIGVGHTRVDSLEEHMQSRDAILDELKLHLLRAQQIMKNSADNHRRQIQLQVGGEGLPQVTALSTKVASQATV